MRIDWRYEDAEVEPAVRQQKLPPRMIRLEFRFGDAPEIIKNERLFYWGMTSWYRKSATYIEKAIKGSIPQPIPIAVFIAVYVTENPESTVNIFHANNLTLHASSRQIVIPVAMSNETNEKKPARLELHIQVTCAKMFYGKRCEVFCKPQFGRHTCGKEGEKLCLGGALCSGGNQCATEPCAPNAVCINPSNGRERRCFCNGNEGSECYPPKEYCSSLPCRHNGTCFSTNKGFVCSCTDMWRGERCEERRLACMEEARAKMINSSSLNTEGPPAVLPKVCLNGGVCLEFPDRFGFQCVCAAEWGGPRCEFSMRRSPGKLAIVLTVLTCSCAVFLAVLLTAWLVHRRMRSKNTAHQQERPEKTRPKPTLGEFISHPILTDVATIRRLQKRISLSNVAETQRKEDMSSKHEAVVYEEYTPVDTADLPEIKAQVDDLNPRYVTLDEYQDMKDVEPVPPLPPNHPQSLRISELSSGESGGSLIPLLGSRTVKTN
ncbi:unnamed protein product [Calicophoron daubneyi]